MDIIGSIMAAFNADMMGAILLIVIGIVLGIIIDKVLSMMMMGGGMMV